MTVTGLVGQLARGFARRVGLTWLLGFGGIVAAIAGRRDLAGLLWLTLGVGSIGVAFDRVTDDTLHFDKVRRRLTDEEIDFLVGHLPFLALGLWALAAEERRRYSRGVGRAD